MLPSSSREKKKQQIINDVQIEKLDYVIILKNSKVQECRI